MLKVSLFLTTDIYILVLMYVQALLRHKAGISSAHHLSGVALMPNSIMEMKSSPLIELYIDELKTVNEDKILGFVKKLF